MSTKEIRVGFVRGSVLLWILALIFALGARTGGSELQASDVEPDDSRRAANAQSGPADVFTRGNAASSLALSRATFAASKDNTLYESSSGSVSNGAGQHFFAGRTGEGRIRRAVIAFDVGSSIPTGSTVTRAALVLYMSRSSAGDVPIELRRVSADWGEGTSDAPANEGGGASAANGDATWLHTFFDSSFWSTAGGDFSALVSATSLVGSTGVYTWTSTPQMVADVQGWLDEPATNFGWLLLGDESRSRTSKRFDSSEHPNQANQPALIVEYRPPPALTVNHPTGAPGSFFTFTGVNFPANGTAAVSVNGRALGTVSTDADGNLVFLIATTGAEEGSYFVSLTVNSRATVGFVLDAAGPVRPKEGSGTVFNLPPGIALTEAIYLPMLLR